MTAALRYVSIAAATAGLALVYVLGGWWALALPVTAVGLLWIVGTWRGWRWAGTLGLLLLVGAAAGALLLHLGLWGAFLGSLAAFVGWDLEGFHSQLQDVPATAATRQLEWRHLLRLLLVAGASSALAGLATAVQVELGTALAILVGVLVVSGVGEAVAFFRRESD